MTDRTALQRDSWEVARLRRYPKAGQTFDQTVTAYIRHSGETYRLLYNPLGTPAPGGDVTMRMSLERCRNSSCSSRDTAVTVDVLYRRLAEVYLAKARRNGGSDIALGAIEDHFNSMNASIRWVELNQAIAECVSGTIKDLKSEVALRRLRDKLAG